ncbi:hypothetical protein AB0C70_14445 [Streptomyces sp. NPDC048564]|uniref:hypothetical protein n=1 Tax=Streptomyces sp. NPDC048564 TaxID=3155760 RepID=UPI00344950E2
MALTPKGFDSTALRKRTALIALPAAALLALDGDLIVHHYYDANDNRTPKLGIHLLNWSTGRPVAY